MSSCLMARARYGANRLVFAFYLMLHSAVPNVQSREGTTMMVQPDAHSARSSYPVADAFTHQQRPRLTRIDAGTMGILI